MYQSGSGEGTDAGREIVGKLGGGKAIALVGRGWLRRKFQVLSGWLGSYLIVDTIVVAATFLHGHTACDALQVVGVTFAALRTRVQALYRSGDG